MQQIVNFFIRNKIFFLFLLLFGLSLIFTVQYHSYHRSRFVNSANFISGGVFSTSNSVSSYFDLKQENLKLQTENERLKNLVYNKKEDSINKIIDSTSYAGTYNVTSALVYKNDYTRKNNVLLINKGKKDSIKQDLAVVSSYGIVGITDNSNNNYTTVLSILNTNILISAKLKKSNHFGTISWDTQSPQFVNLTEIPKVAPIVIGDTIVTSGRSAIFPKNILIGTVENFSIQKAGNFYNLKVKLFNDMTSLDHVYIIENRDKKAIDELLKQSDE